MKNTIDVSRLATDREMKIVRDKLRGPHIYMEHIKPRKNYLDTIGEISFIISCLFCLAAYIQYG
jgi:hypothetical protein